MIHNSMKRNSTLRKLEDVLLPVNDPESTFRRQLAYVPCVEPTILVQNLHISIAALDSIPHIHMALALQRFGT